MDRVEKRLVVERFAEISGRAGGQAMGAGLRLVMPGDDHDRDTQGAACQLPLDVEAVHAGHVEIEDDAVRNLRRERVKELPPRREGIRIQVRRPKEPLQSLSDRLVVIDDGDAESRSVHAAHVDSRSGATLDIGPWSYS